MVETPSRKERTLRLSRTTQEELLLSEFKSAELSSICTRIAGRAILSFLIVVVLLSDMKINNALIVILAGTLVVFFWILEHISVITYTRNVLNATLLGNRESESIKEIDGSIIRIRYLVRNNSLGRVIKIYLLIEPVFWIVLLFISYLIKHRVQI